MADYYPLLEKAVAKLKDATPEARQAIYERARKALAGQLRNLDPPVQEEAIEREAQALEVAIAQLETNVVAHPVENAVPVAETDYFGLGPPTGSGAEPLANAKNTRQPQPFMPESNPRAGFIPSPAEDAPHLPQTPPLRFRRKAFDERPSNGTENGTRPFPDADFAEPQNAPDSDSSSAESFAGETSAAEAPDLSASDKGPEFAAQPRKRLEIRHSFGVEPEQVGGHRKRLVAVGIIVGLIVFFVAIAAYRLRDRPEDLMQVQAPAAQVEGASGGKIADRVADRAVPGSSSPSPAAPSAAAGLSDEPRRGSGQASPPLSVARRAALLVQSPDGKTKVNTYIGTVVWRAENVSAGPDEPLRTAVHAEIDIPEEKFRVDVLIQKNFDTTLPASHTVKLVFALPEGSPLGGIKQISALQMRQEDTPTGEALKGISVPIVENSFLIGLARGDAEPSNLEHLRSREWLDVPMVLANGLIAKLTFEKGPSGQRVVDDAIASWQAQ